MELHGRRTTFEVVAIRGLFRKEPFLLSTSSTPLLPFLVLLQVAYTMPGKEKKRWKTPKITPYRGKEEHKKEEKRVKKVEKIIPFEGKAKKKEEKEEKQEKKVQRIIPFEGKAKKEEEKEEKLIPFEGMAKKEEEKEEKLFLFEGKANKDQEKEEKQGKKVQRIIPFEGKAKMEEKKETLATVFGERMLGSMPSDEVGLAPEAPAPPRLSAYRRANRRIIRPFLG